MFRTAKQSRMAAPGNPDAALLIIGAGAAGAGVARDLLKDPKTGCYPEGFLDDDPGRRTRGDSGSPWHGRGLPGSLASRARYLSAARAFRASSWPGKGVGEAAAAESA
ncbi:MAG: hypothetical protein HYS36_06695 [Candidatus Rokubacteria bacterium]|nr:hypothetical protein [Candidatus Rokubacteria bacterium]